MADPSNKADARSSPRGSDVLSGAHAIVLAAGRGSRMGGPKALMPVGGRPWWKVQAEKIERARVPATWVVSAQVRQEMSRDPLQPARIVTGDPMAPMFASVVAGLRAVANSAPVGVFVLPVDVPAALPKVWCALAEAGGVAIPAHRDKGGHPIYLAWTWVMRVLRGPVVEGHDPSGMRLDELVAGDAREVPVDDRSVVLDLNTPADVQAYLDTASIG